ncbi:arginine repressor C-terminal-like domain-containing protein [Tanacetum coccineum]
MNTSSGIGVSTESDDTMNEDTLVGVASGVKEGVTPSVGDMMVEKDKISSLEDTTVPKSFPPLIMPVTTTAGNAPVWVKLHGVSVTAFNEDGLSAIAIKLGTPLNLDSYTSNVCMQSWGRSSYARVMIELQADVELKDNIVMAMPKINREGHYTCVGEKKTVKKPSQTSRGVSVGPKMSFKPQKEHRPVPKNSTACSSGNKKKGWYQWGATNLGNNGATSNGSSFINVDNSISGTTPIIEKIGKFKDLLTSGQVIHVDKADNPLKKVEFPCEYDSEDDVASVDNDMARSIASEIVASILVIVNGSPTKEFRLERGLQQGDPLSPFLFLIVAKALKVTILKACDKGIYNGLSLVESGSNLSLLQYADDALFFGEWSRSNASILIHILHCFELALGLKVNMTKSRILGVGVPNSDVENIASSLGCSHDFLLFSYLGLPVRKRPRSCSGWSDVINRFRDRLSSWKAKSLSIGSLLEVGVGSLLAKNLGLLGKWKWRFLVEKIVLWRIVIKDFYRIDGGFGSSHNSFGLSGIWCDIIKYVSCIDPIFNNSFALKVSSGLVTSFWVDPWCPNGPILKNVYPRLFALETQKDCKVADRWKFFNGIWVGNWLWRLPPRGRAIDDLASLEGLIGSLKVKSLSKSIQNLLLASDIIDKHSLWNSWIHRKVNICMLRASLDRLTTRVSLSYHGVALPSLNFPLCSNAPEEIDHCIIHCPCAISIWRKVWSWWNLSTSVVFPLFSIADITAGKIKAHGCCPCTNKILQGVFYCVVWSIWNWRNRIVNADVNHVDSAMVEDIFPSIQRVSKIWISARFKSQDASWSCWIPRPFDILSKL